MTKFVTIALAVALALTMGLCAMTEKTEGKELPAEVVEAAENVKGIIEEVTERISDRIEGVTEEISDGIEDVTKELADGIEDVTEEISDGLEEITENAAPMLGGLVGGWTAAEDPEITDEILELFNKATEGLLGVNYVPVAFLGTQVVAGRNVAILCQATVVVPDAAPSWKVVFINEDPEGNASILTIADFDFWTLCTYGAPED